MVLSTPLPVFCLSVVMFLLPAYCPMALSVSSQAPLTIQEVDGMMYITEPVNTFQMDRHIQLWAADLHGQRDTEKLDLLLASKTIREMSLLMSYLKTQAAKGTSTTLPWMAVDSSLFCLQHSTMTTSSSGTRGIYSATSCTPSREWLRMRSLRSSDS